MAFVLFAFYPIFWLYYYFTIHKGYGGNGCFFSISILFGTLFAACVGLSHYAVFSEHAYKKGIF